MTVKQDIVYVIDREGHYVKHFNDIFQNENVKTVVEANSVKGLHEIKKTFPDMVIIYDTPSSNGISTCCFIKQDVRTCNIPVLILSSKNNEESGNLKSLSKADEILSCFIEPAVLLAAYKKIRKEKVRHGVKNIMNRNILFVQENTPVLEAINLLIKNNISGLPVVSTSGKLSGILTEKDLLKLFDEEHLEGKLVKDYMQHRVKSFDEDSDISEVCTCLINEPFRRIPIVSNGEITGIISRRDILKFMLELRK